MKPGGGVAGSGLKLLAKRRAVGRRIERKAERSNRISQDQISDLEIRAVGVEVDNREVLGLFHFDRHGGDMTRGLRVDESISKAIGTDVAEVRRVRKSAVGRESDDP